jgi:hypothetical protein
MTGPRELAAYRAERIDPATNAERKEKRMTRTNAALEIPADDFAAANERLAKIGLAPTVETRDEQLAADIAEVVSEAQRPALAVAWAQTPIEPEQSGRQKQTRLSVKQLRERFADKVESLNQSILDARAVIAESESCIEEYEADIRIWKKALEEFDRD